MVTFSLPGDDGVADRPNGTPKPRPPLPFAKRSFAASPFASGSARRNGTPHAASSRKLLTTRDEVPSSSLNNSSIATARNIFQASAIGDSPPRTLFSPSLPQSTMKKVFAPTGTPEPTRMYRESTAHATPRGMAAKVADKELFPMRISSPPPELTGEVLTQKVPKDWNSKSSIYADQFLAHLCPPGLDEEQRRQFFCILDLRRLKYAANEIFSSKDWKLNAINFAKEFEKSRSIILLRYGLYEFQNVKPSKEVLKRWRREHGLPEPEEEAVDSTPSKPAASKKRKADDDMSKDSLAPRGSTVKGKRRATDMDDEEPAVATPALARGKRKASVSEEQPAKMHRPTPSSASKSLFEKIANKPAATAQASENPPATKTNAFATNKSGVNSLARSVFTNLKPPASQAPSAGSNIFGYLSDASSAKNSGVEADAESESETGSEEEGSPEAGQSDEPSVASGAAETGSQISSGLFGKKPAPPTSGFGAGVLSQPETRESTPGRSLFDRITKDSDGQPVRAEDRVDATVSEESATPTDQTWNPSTTPLKFAPSVPATQKSSMFGNAASTPASSIFGAKATASSNLFSTAKPDAPPAKESSVGTSADEGAKDGGESDKENESQPNKKALFEPKAPAAQQPSFGSSLFQPKPAAAEAPKETEAPKSTPNMFGSMAKADSKPEASATPSLFGASNKSSGATFPPAPAAQTSSLFGSKPAEPAKPAEPEKPAASDAPKAASMFGGQNSSGTTSSLFGAAKPATAPSTGFGTGASTPSAPVFGNGSAIFGNNGAAAKAGDAPATTDAASKPTFSFGSTSAEGQKSNGPAAAAPKPLFGLPKSPTGGTAANGMFNGSPMKQDDPSPAKKAFTGGSNAGSAAPIFSFGNTPSTNAFGGAAAGAPSGSQGTPGISFGADSSAANAGSGSGGFNFSFNAGGASATSGTSFNNPFAGASNASSGTPTGGAFTFGGAPSGPASGSSTPFQFGGAGAGGSSSTPAPSGGFVFGANQPSNNATPMFGGASTPSGAPSFSFSGAPSQPPQGAGSMFGSNSAAPAFGGLQPPAGGSSTTGTNSPLNFGGGSSLATTPAAGTPEPSNQNDGTNGGEDEGEKHEQINLTDGVDADEEVLHEVRAKVLKYVPPDEQSDKDDKAKSKSPWTTQGVGPLRLLKNKESGAVRLLLRAEPRGHVALNRTLLPSMKYKADEKYVKITTSNEKGDGLETWMIQVKTKDLAKAAAEAFEKNKESNKS